MGARLLATAPTLLVGLALAGCGGGDDPNADAPLPTGNPVITEQAQIPQTAPPQASTPQQDAIAKPRPIPQLVASNPDLQILKTALGAAGLTSTLSQGGPYTVFAPANDAFSKMGSRLDTLLAPASKAALAEILKFHVVSGEINVRDLKDGQLLTTLQGTRLRVTRRQGGEVQVGNSQGRATIISADLDASNGVVDEIDSVLTPKQPK